jgi:K+-sensing histidine kinase KdpD
MNDRSEERGEKFTINRELLDAEISGSSFEVESITLIQEMLNASPYVSAIINDQQQIILSNNHLVRISSMDTIEQLLGRRPGNVLSCIHKDKNQGCTTTDNCKYCGIVNTLRKSQHLQKKVTNECRITTTENQRLISHDFKVTCAPIYLGGKAFTLMHMEDISHEKRKAILENVFFHDVLNRLGGLSGLIQLIKANNRQSELEEYVEMLETIGEVVIEDIQNQQYLKSAENDNLIVNFREHLSGEIIESVRRQIIFNPIISSMHLKVHVSFEDFRIKTDSALLKRILLNMAKNAAEASPEYGTIKLRALQLNDAALFYVNNQGTIPQNIQKQIYQRSFTTKGHGRGLGTYSMKLFGEGYLHGKVYFVSERKKGTTFTIELPLVSE